MNNFKFLLFIDDDQASNYYHEYILKDSDIVDETRSFLSSSEALNYFKNASENKDFKIPDLIFLDLNIPELNGWEFLEEFNKINLMQQPKIIFLSNSMNPIDKKSAEENNLVLELINKPLTIEYIKNLKDRIDIN